MWTIGIGIDDYLTFLTTRELNSESKVYAVCRCLRRCRHRCYLLIIMATNANMEHRSMSRVLDCVSI